MRITASTLCYTSGTTGHPKGVLYSHRSTVLHAFGACATDSFGFSARDTILVVVPLFHANAWGIPFAAALCGAKLVLPGPKLDPESIYTLLQQEACTGACGIPTVWLNFLAWVEANKTRLELSQLKLRRVSVGGTAPPRKMIETFRDLFGVFLLHAWGMTETSPIVTIGALLAKHEAATPDEIVDPVQGQAGTAGLRRPELRLVGADGGGLPHDEPVGGRVAEVRGNWVISGYFKGEGGEVVDRDGWFATGDVATIDPDGYVQLTDRLKDVIKSGGEWISTIEIENLAVSHPDVFEAAVIAVHHPVWQERPLLLVQPKPGRTPDKQSILDFLAPHIAKWWMPDDVVVVDSLPHTATGKLLKTELRARYHGHLALHRIAHGPGRSGGAAPWIWIGPGLCERFKLLRARRGDDCCHWAAAVRPLVLGTAGYEQIRATHQPCQHAAHQRPRMASRIDVAVVQHDMAGTANAAG